MIYINMQAENKFSAENPIKTVRSLYIHIPFCAKKCIYCAFFSAPPSENQIEQYCQCLLIELEMVAETLKPQTIFIGGGTPSLLNTEQWKKLLKGLERLNLLGAEEFTIECNPATVSDDKARLWLDYGVNRISIGVQSFDDDILKLLGRIHNKQTALNTYETFRKTGFENINIDLIFGVPGQTLDLWQKTIQEAFSLQTEHLSCYELTPEEDTEYFKSLNSGNYTVDEELVSAMYDELVEKAYENGLFRYEVSNFARDKANVDNGIPSFACKHNVNYWRGKWYYGAGASASGFKDGIRTRNVSNTELYCQLLKSGKSPVEEIDKIPPLSRAGEIAAFGLRMDVGWGYAEFLNATGFDLRTHWQKEMVRLIGLGYAVGDEKSFRLTPIGLRFADWAGELFIR